MLLKMMKIRATGSDFNPSKAKMYVADDATKFAIKTINSKKYAFDETGVMQDGWTDTLATDADVATITEYQYFNGGDEGWRLQKGWVKVVPAEKVNKSAYDGDLQSGSMLTEVVMYITQL